MIQQLLCFLFSIWIECTSVSFVETAEHLIIFQTKYLNTYDQSFESAYEQVAEDYSEPVRISAFSAGQLKYYFHDSGMADSKCTDTDKGNSV